MIIQIFQLLYYNYNEILEKEILSNNKILKQIFYYMLKNFFGCKIIIENGIKNNDDLFQEMKQTTKYLTEIIKNYLLLLIDFFDCFNFFLDIPDNFNFEPYIELIYKNLNGLIAQIIEKENEKLLNKLINIYINSGLYYNEAERQKINNNLELYSSIIFNFLNNFLQKKIINQINNNIGFKNIDEPKIINNYSLIPNFRLLVRIIINNNIKNINDIFYIIDDLIYNSFSKITDINILEYNDFLSFNINQFN